MKTKILILATMAATVLAAVGCASPAEEEGSCSHANNCGPEVVQVKTDQRIDVDVDVEQQSYARIEMEAEGGCSSGLMLMCLQYCGGYCSNNGQSCVCPRGPR